MIRLPDGNQRIEEAAAIHERVFGVEQFVGELAGHLWTGREQFAEMGHTGFLREDGARDADASDRSLYRGTAEELLCRVGSVRDLDVHGGVERAPERRLRQFLPASADKILPLRVVGNPLEWRVEEAVREF